MLICSLPAWWDELLPCKGDKDRLVNMFRILFLIDFRLGPAMEVGMGGSWLVWPDSELHTWELDIDEGKGGGDCGDDASEEENCFKELE